MTLNDPGWLSNTPMPQSGEPKRRNPLLIGGLVFLGLVVLSVVIVVVVKAGQSTKSITTDTTVDTTPGGTDTTTGGTSSTSSSVQHPQPLSAVLPTGVDVSANCGPLKSLPTGLEQANTSYACDVAALGSGAQVFAYQFPSAGDYEAALIAYNKFKQLDPSATAKGCPPGSSGSGVDTWQDHTGNSGTLECLTQSNTAGGPTSPTYIWTIPVDNAILEAIAPANGTFAALEKWWTDNA